MALKVAGMPQYLAFIAFAFIWYWDMKACFKDGKFVAYLRFIVALAGSGFAAYLLCCAAFINSVLAAYLFFNAVFFGLGLAHT